MSITPRARELTVAAAEAAADKLAEDIVAFDVSEQLVITDAFLICSAPNDRQVKSIVDAVEERLFYSLERIWKDCPTVELPDEVRRGRSIHDAGSRRDSADGSRRGNADVAGSSVRGAAS